MASAPWGWYCCFCWQKLWKPKAGVLRKFLYSQGKRVNFFYCWPVFYVCMCMCTCSLIAGRVCAALVTNVIARVRGPSQFRQFCLKGDLCCERIWEPLICCIIPGHATLKYGSVKACCLKAHLVPCFVTADACFICRVFFFFFKMRGLKFKSKI